MGEVEMPVEDRGRWALAADGVWHLFDRPEMVERAAGDVARCGSPVVWAGPIHSDPIRHPSRAGTTPCLSCSGSICFATTLDGGVVFRVPPDSPVTVPEDLGITAPVELGVLGVEEPLGPPGVLAGLGPVDYLFEPIGAPEWTAAVYSRMMLAGGARPIPPISIEAGPSSVRMAALRAAPGGPAGPVIEEHRPAIQIYDGSGCDLVLGSRAPLLVCCADRSLRGELPLWGRGGHHLFRALRHLGYDEIDVLLVHARDAEGQHRRAFLEALWRALEPTRPTWVALGAVARRLFDRMGIAGRAVIATHPETDLHHETSPEAYAASLHAAGVRQVMGHFLPGPDAARAEPADGALPPWSLFPDAFELRGWNEIARGIRSKPGRRPRRRKARVEAPAAAPDDSVEAVQISSIEEDGGRAHVGRLAWRALRVSLEAFTARVAAGEIHPTLEDLERLRGLAGELDQEADEMVGPLARALEAQKGGGALAGGYRG